MTASAKNTFGVIFKLAVSPSSPATVAELNDLNPPAVTRDTIDATTHDSTGGAAEYISDGVYDNGELTLEGNLIGGSTADDLFLAGMASGALHAWSYTIKAASGTETRSGTGYITAYEPGPLPVRGGKQTFSATIKVTGAVTQAPTA